MPGSTSGASRSTPARCAFSSTWRAARGGNRTPRAADFFRRCPLTTFGGNTTTTHSYDRRFDAVNTSLRDLADGLDRIDARQRWTLIGALILGLLLVILGCAKNQIQGGQTRAQEQAVRLRVSTPDYRVELDDSRQSESTTQPSAWGDDLPRLGDARLGELAGIGFSQAKRSFPHALPLGLIFLAAAAILWLLGSPVFAAAAAALAVLSFLAPGVIVWAGIAVLALIGWRVFAKNRSFKQVVDGVQNLFQGKSLEQIAEMKAYLAAKQDETTQREVRKAKGKA